MEECETKDNFCANSDESKDGNSIASDIVEDRDTGFVEETLSNSDNFEIESGVESATGDVTEADWTELAELLDLNSYLTGSDESLRLGDLDLTTEQAQETLKYFTLASDRTNQMTKTHNDLDAILQLLQEKEKDLELAARIGQSLLERNKQLLAKTQAFESFVAECDEKETQLQHEVSMKNELLQKFLRDQELEEYYQLSHRSDEDSRSSDSFCRDESINSLQQKCEALEQQNTHLILEALQIKEETASAEMKEQQLVLDCVKQLVEAKDQISSLTDEISQKAEDNIRQQEEITHLITTVVDLQKRHKELSSNNDDLQSLLNSSQANQEQLKTQVNDLQEKYHECLEMLMENQREVKKLNTKIESDSGLPREAPCFPEADGQAVCKWNNSVMLKRIQNLSLILEPGNKVSYSNLGFGLLGQGLALSQNSSYEDWIQENIFEPLGMQDSGFRLTPEMRQKIPVGYLKKLSLEPVEWGWASPAGGMFTSIEDIAKLEIKLFNSTDEDDFLSPVITQEFFSPAYILDGKQFMGSPWEMYLLNDYLARIKSGYVYGYSSKVFLFPDLKLAFNVFNTGSIKSCCLPMASRLVKSFHDELTARDIERHPTVSLDEAAPYLGEFYTNDVPTIWRVFITHENNKLLFKVDNQTFYLNHICGTTFELIDRRKVKCIQIVVLGVNHEKVYFDPPDNSTNFISPGFTVFGFSLRGKARFHRTSNIIN